jgi:hypothetical protein
MAETVLGKWHCGSTFNLHQRQKGDRHGNLWRSPFNCQHSFEQQPSNAQLRQLGTGPNTQEDFPITRNEL